MERRHQQSRHLCSERQHRNWSCIINGRFDRQSDANPVCSISKHDRDDGHIRYRHQQNRRPDAGSAQVCQLRLQRVWPADIQLCDQQPDDRAARGVGRCHGGRSDAVLDQRTIESFDSTARPQFCSMRRATRSVRRTFVRSPTSLRLTATSQRSSAATI